MFGFHYYNEGPNAPEPTFQLSLESRIGEAGITEGFTYSPAVNSYTATAGRYRLDLSQDGFVICAANEERLCYNADGTFRGQYLQGADTYYSAPWHDPAAPHTSADPAYIVLSSGGTVTYAGSHSEPDIFGGTGGGFLITQTDTNGNTATADNVKATGVVAGDILRHYAIVSVTTTGAGSVGVRGSGNVTSNFNFTHDASGNITGFTEAWTNRRAGYYDMGTINGKRWWYLWCDMPAANTTDQACGVNLSSTVDLTGRIVHVCDVGVQKNPQTPPAAVPVCATAKTFAADTLNTVLSGIGYVCDNLCLARSTNTGGAVIAPSVSVGVPYEPLETRIQFFEGTETGDRSGIMPNVNQALYNRPWLTPTNFTIYYGPGFFPTNWLNAISGSTCVNASVVPVFKGRKDLRPILGKASVSHSFVTGVLTLDDNIFLGVGDTVSEYWQQTSIRATSGSGASFALNGATGVYARNCLVMGASLHTTRARYSIQQDATPAQQVYVGEWLPGISSDGVIDFSGTRFDRLARINAYAVTATVQVALNVDGIAADFIWSDPLYWGQGTFPSPQTSRRFNGRTTNYDDLSFWQSRVEIQVDTGSGWVPYSSSGLTFADLPHGHEAFYVGTWDFGTSTLTPGTDANKVHRVRYYHNSGLSGGKISRPGYEWQASQDYGYGTHSRYQNTGDVYEIDTGSMKLRFVYDKGQWNTGPTYVTGTQPSGTATGTHPDNEQVNRTSNTITNQVADGCVFLNGGQGPFRTGVSGASPPSNGTSITNSTFSNIVAVLGAVSNAYRFDHSRTVSSVETLEDSVFIQSISPFRFMDGSGIGMTMGAGGTRNTLTVNNVTIASAASTVDASSGGGTMVGTPEHITMPKAVSYTSWTTPGASTYTINQLLEDANIDATSGQALPVTDPWNFRFKDTAASVLGFDPNAVIETAIGDHPEWDDVIENLVSIYFREPDFYTTLSAASAMGTVVLSGVTAEKLHTRYSGNPSGYFTIVGDELQVAKSLSGVNRVFVLRGDNDETYVIDVS